MMRKRVSVGVLIILAGVLVTTYPWLRAAYFEYNKNKVLNQWERMIASVGMVKIQEAPELFSSTIEPETPRPQLNDDVWEEDINVHFNTAYVLENMEGIITIDKINHRYPILRSDTKYNLDLAICSITGSPEMGGMGNYCLAGHKSRIYGRQFNRLMELQKGDTVSLSNGENNFDYVVVQTMHVDPEDTWVLDDVAGEKILTLITCDYTANPIGRFIVKCEPIVVKN